MQFCLTRDHENMKNEGFIMLVPLYEFLQNIYFTNSLQYTISYIIYLKEIYECLKKLVAI